MKVLTAALFGVIFGLGLLISGMLDPDKVLGFLDVAGAWNPQLAFVMGGAILAAFPAFLIARRRTTTLLGDPLKLPDRWPLDRRLVIGSAMFGAGWGLAGICPGPGIVLLGLAGPPIWIFAAAMLAGVLVARTLGPARAGGSDD